MKKLDAAAMKRIAPGAAMVLLAGPVFLFMATDLLLFATLSGGKPTAPNHVVDLSMEIVLCIFTGLLASFGARIIWRVLRE
jgi:hypothetical protein